MQHTTNKRLTLDDDDDVGMVTVTNGDGVDSKIEDMEPETY